MAFLEKRLLPIAGEVIAQDFCIAFGKMETIDLGLLRLFSAIETSVAHYSQVAGITDLYAISNVVINHVIIYEHIFTVAYANARPLVRGNCVAADSNVSTIVNIQSSPLVVEEVIIVDMKVFQYFIGEGSDVDANLPGITDDVIGHYGRQSAAISLNVDILHKPLDGIPLNYYVPGIGESNAKLGLPLRLRAVDDIAFDNHIDYPQASLFINIRPHVQTDSVGGIPGEGIPHNDYISCLSSIATPDMVIICIPKMIPNNLKMAGVGVDSDPAHAAIDKMAALDLGVSASPKPY